MYLPPYSPDLMPLEEVFTKVKEVLRRNDSAYISTHSPELFIKLAFSSIEHFMKLAQSQRTIGLDT